MRQIRLILPFIMMAVAASAQQVPELTFEELQSQYLQSGNDTVYVVNFWATWCGPCVKELPQFEKVTKEMKGRKVQVVLVSLDFPRQVESQLKPFVQKNNLQSRVVFLNAPGENEWIPQVSEEWDGTIPATLIVFPDGSKKFISGSTTFEEINSIIQSK